MTDEGGGTHAAGRLERTGLALAYALLFAASFPFRAGDLRFDFGLVAGWLALVPLALLVRGLAPGRAFAWASAAGVAGFVPVVFWLYVVTVRFGGAPPLAGAGAVLGMSLACGLHVGLAGGLVAWLRPSLGSFGPAVLPVAWVVTEHLRGFDLFGGFPWAYLGYSAHANGPILELASLGGVWGLSLLLATFATLLAERRYSPALALLAFAHVIGFGLRLASLPEPEATPVEPPSALLVQGNIPQDLKWDPQRAGRNFRTHVELTRAGATPGSLVLWPEAAVPVFLETQPEYRQVLVDLARETGTTLVVGAPGVRFRGRDRPPSIYNSVFVIDPEQGVADRYDKTHLVPFGEYVPWRSVLGFVSAIATGLADTIDVTPGDRPRALRGLEWPRGGTATALICYEVIYPDLVRQAVRDGSRVLLNLTNDAWYGFTSAPHQFLAIAAMRSAEHGLPMLRAANTGVSGVVDAGGVVIRETPIFERLAVPVVLPPARDGETLYTRFGDWIVWGSWLALGGLAIAARAGGKRVRGTEGESEGDRRAARGSG